MKKFLLTTVILSIITLFASCGSDNKEDEPDPEPAPVEKNIEGVWENGNYFVSFSNAGYYCAYLGDDFLDSGSYKRNKDEIMTDNSYFSRKTIYLIKKLDEKNLQVEVSFTDVYGQTHNEIFSFIKSEIEPAKEGQLAGKSFSWLNPYFGTVTTSFITSNSGIRLAQSGSAARYPLNFYYFYLGDKLYYQIVRNYSMQVPTIGGWSDGSTYYTARCLTVKIETNGNLWWGDSIEIK